MVAGPGQGEGWRGEDSTAGVSVRETGQGQGQFSNLLQGESRRGGGVVTFFFEGRVVEFITGKGQLNNIE